MASERLLCNHAYLYQSNNGVISLYQGRVVGSFLKEQGCFLSRIKRHQCSIHDGILFNDVVWFLNRDDERAKVIFKEGIEQSIRLHEAKIRLNWTKLKTLEQIGVIEC